MPTCSSSTITRTSLTPGQQMQLEETLMLHEQLVQKRKKHSEKVILEDFVMLKVIGKVQRFPEHRARCYAAVITLAIEYGHNSDVIYSDLKTENVLLEENGQNHFIDIGLSKEGSRATSPVRIRSVGRPEPLGPRRLPFHCLSVEEIR
ncbi:Protein kinase domain [Phytophthora infestans]|uniref:non-specific serine/threonine protein kinase n=1 Tax=Phytophthora infestans TaxID=4787 RepID=A0A833S4Q7_PHYIN|nr:Protein kinase domain [Phytophthora infestans]